MTLKETLELLEERLESKEFWLAFALISLLGAISQKLWLDLGWLLLVLSSIIAFKALLELREGKFGIDALMSIVGFVTFWLGAKMEGFIIYTLFGIAEALEEIAEAWAKRSLKELLELIPQRVLKVEGDTEREVDVGDLSLNDQIRVRVGERVPADSVSLSEKGLVDLSIVTGESQPLQIKKGDLIPSGALVLTSPLLLKVVKDPKESTAQMIIKQVKESLERKGRVESFLERISAPYTIFVLLAFIIASALLDPYRSLSVILAGCPSAFIITSTVATILSIARMAKRGVVLKGGPPLDSAPRIDVVILDKTGTVTLGEPKVTSEICLNFDERKFRWITRELCSYSLHPVSRALSNYLRELQGSNNHVELKDIQEVPGKGVVAQLETGERVILGSYSFILESGISLPEERLRDLSVLLAIGDRVIGGFQVEDLPREGAKESIEALRDMGLKVLLVSGDKRDKVERIAKELGIEEYSYEVKPEDKLRIVREFQEAGKRVAMIGDGVNDAPALAEADLGVAIGQYALVAEIADAVILSGDIRKFIDIIRLGRLREKVLRLGIGSAMVLKVAVIVLGLMGMLPIWLIAALGDDGSTLLGLTSTLGLLRGEKN